MFCLIRPIYAPEFAMFFAFIDSRHSLSSARIKMS